MNTESQGALPNEGEFEIVSLNVSRKTGTRKAPTESVVLVEGSGIEGDAHAGILEKRQVSFLAAEEIEGASALLAGKCALAGGLDRLAPGDFAENVTTRGVALHLLPLGTEIRIGEALLEVSQIGKECHAACEIRRLVGDLRHAAEGHFRPRGARREDKP